MDPPFIWDTSSPLVETMDLPLSPSRPLPVPLPLPPPLSLATPSRLRGWRNTIGNLIEFFWLKKQHRGPQFTGICVKDRGVRFHRFRDLKQYDFNSIPPTSRSYGLRVAESPASVTVWRVTDHWPGKGEPRKGIQPWNHLNVTFRSPVVT